MLRHLLCRRPTALADDYNWKLQSFWGGGSAPQKLIEQFADNMNVASGGSINITILPNKAIVAHNQTLQAVDSGILDLQKSTPATILALIQAFGLLCMMNSWLLQRLSIHNMVLSRVVVWSWHAKSMPSTDCTSLDQCRGAWNPSRQRVRSEP